MGPLSSWKTSLFRNNVWITGCTWLPNPSMYSLAVIQPWRVIMGPREYCTMILLSKPSQNCWNQEFRIVGFLECSPNINSSWCRKQHDGRLIWLSHRAFPADTIVYASEHYFQ
jgi:hypothetical protein